MPNHYGPFNFHDGRLPDRLEQRIDALPDITLVR
jgi:hypothetical protein